MILDEDFSRRDEIVAKRGSLAFGAAQRKPAFEEDKMPKSTLKLGRRGGAMGDMSDDAFDSDLDVNLGKPHPTPPHPTTPHNTTPTFCFPLHTFTLFPFLCQTVCLLAPSHPPPLFPLSLTHSLLLLTQLPPSTLCHLMSLYPSFSLPITLSLSL